MFALHRGKDPVLVEDYRIIAHWRDVSSQITVLTPPLALQIIDLL